MPQTSHLTFRLTRRDNEGMPIVKCGVCQKEFYGKPCFIKMGYCKYCSKKCQAEAQKNGKYCNCFVCGRPVWRSKQYLTRSKSGYFFCTKSCQTLWRNKYFSGEKHPNWRGGAHQAYRQRLMDDGADQICSKCETGDFRVLIVHHKDRNRANNKISNLTWLCHNCHFLEHFCK